MKSVIKPTSAPEWIRVVDMLNDVAWDNITASFAMFTDTYVFSMLWVTTQTIVLTYTNVNKDVLRTVTKS